MGVNQRIFQQSDGLESLKELMELFKNPDNISKTAELARQEAALTADELAKSEDARIFLTNYDKLLSEFNSAKEKLLQDQNQHADNVNQFILEKSAKEEEFKQIGLNQYNASIAQTQTDRRLSDENVRLEQKKKDFAEECADKVKEIERRERSVEEGIQQNIAKKNELSIYESGLKQKAAKLKEQLADL